MIEVPASASPAVARSITTARRLIAGVQSANTRRAYETGWRQSKPTPRGLGQESLGAHPALVATFLGSLRDGGASAQTLGSRAAAIRSFHREAGSGAGIADRAPGGARYARGRPAGRRRP